MENHTAKHFALQLGSLISLYLSLSFLITLLFGVITILHPDPANGSYELLSAQDSVRLGIAMVIVFFPTYILLTRSVNKLRRTMDGAYIGITKWLIYLSLLVGGLALLADLVVVIMSFLNGELTLRFMLKAITVFVIVGAAFYYYFLDAKGHWLTHEKQSKQYAALCTVIVLAALVLGFSRIELPTAVREQKLDAQEITDLQTIQYRIQDYYVTNQKLPASLSELPAPVLPSAPNGRTPYDYKITTNGFELCATFSNESQPNEYMGTPALYEKSLIMNPDNWQHGAGMVCFSRVINKNIENTQPSLNNNLEATQPPLKKNLENSQTMPPQPAE